MKIKFFIHPDFRREQFLEGIDVPSEFETECFASVITKAQRQFILDFYQNRTQGLPEVLELKVPCFRANEPDFRWHWYGRLDPNFCDLEAILDAWIADYNSEKTKVEEETRNYTPPPEIHLKTQGSSRTR